MGEPKVSEKSDARGTKPWYLFLLAVLLMMGGAVNSFLAMGVTVVALSGGRGSAVFLFLLVYMHVLWWALVVAGFGISQGFEWARWVMSAALVGLFLGTVLQPGGTLVAGVTYLILYGIAIAATFTPRASAYFALRKADQSNAPRASAGSADAS